jgi:drug/metabolite transporter (DMT)-like permease
VGSLRDEVRAPLSAHLAIGAAQIGFGLFPVVGKLAFPPRGPFPPFAVAAFRAGFGAASLFLLAELVKAPRVERRGDYARLAVYAFFGIVLNQVLYLKGLDLSSATHAGLLVATTPAVAYVLAIIVRRERASLRPSLGVFLAVLGAAWVVLIRQVTPGKAPTRLGDMLIFLNQACYAVYLVFVRDVLERVDPIRAIAWIFVFGAIANVPIGLKEAIEVPWTQITRADAWHLAFILIFPTSVGYALNAYALKRAPATLAAIYTSAQPVIATIGAVWILDERASVPETIGATALILVGVTLVALRRVGSSP